jgi:arylsulfatase
MSSARPNILFIFTDQQRYDTVAALGNPMIRTPVLDRLVREGTTFSRCYTPSPVCVAARCAMMTGLPPHITGCCDNEPMPGDRVSFVERLRAVGYQTHGVGKMHFTPDHTRMWGFEGRDIAEELKESDDDYRRFVGERGYGHIDEVNGIRSEYYYVPQPSQLPAALHQTTWVGDRSLDFLERRDEKRPFFLMTSFLKPHPPFESPTPWNKLYRSVEMAPPHCPVDAAQFNTYWNELQNRFKYCGAWGRDEMLVRTMKAAYYGCISFVDFQIGRLLSALGPALQDTLVVFSSDHGELLGDYGCVGKRTMHEVSARVPLIVRWPAGLAGGSVSTCSVTLLDLYPTFMAVAGTPESPSREGLDLARVLSSPPENRWVFSQFSKRSYAQYLASDGRCKYSYSAPDRRETLVDLISDPLETCNLVGSTRHDALLAAARSAVFSRFQRDGYTDAVQGDVWRLYPQPKLPSNPDENIIFQDPPSVEARLKELGGYYRPSSYKFRDGSQILADIADNA